ncbi:hypothetical protein UlMin_015466 [Ulmus minor]
MAPFLNPNVQLDRFDGTNFTYWKGKLFFLLTILKIAYDKVTCRVHILNTLSYMLYDFYNSMETPKKIWTTLEYKYKAKKEGIDKFLIFKYFKFTVVETKYVLDQIHELQIIISESFQAGAIITKLLQSWNDYKKKLLHMRDDISLEELQKYLRIEEETRSRDQKNVPRDSSKINIVEGNNRKKKNDHKNNNTNNEFKKISINKKIFSGNCFHCGKKGHSDCKFKKKWFLEEGR